MFFLRWPRSGNPKKQRNDITPYHPLCNMPHFYNRRLNTVNCLCASRNGTGCIRERTQKKNLWIVRVMFCCDVQLMGRDFLLLKMSMLFVCFSGEHSTVHHLHSLFDPPNIHNILYYPANAVHNNNELISAILLIMHLTVGCPS